MPATVDAVNHLLVATGVSQFSIWLMGEEAITAASPRWLLYP